MPKYSLEKLQDGMINTINKYNNKSNNKNKDMITKAFEEFILSEILLSVISQIPFLE